MSGARVLAVRIVDEPHASESDKQIVRDHLDTYNVAVTGMSEYASVSLFLEDEHNEVVGGLLGNIWGGCLHVTYLWIAETLRGRGHGRALLQRAEARARERGCHAVFLETFSFQAPDFYKKLGYEVFGEAADWPLHHTHYFLSKRLDTDPPSHPTPPG
jgi:ribosomal protein S18 acetylase RimI-like enzyme